MMRNMPESCYELSLKDLVELPRPPPHPHRLPEEEKRPSLEEYYRRRGQGYGNRTTTMMAMGRSGSMGKGHRQQEGLLLKMVFPVHTGVGGARGRRKQRKERSEEDCSEDCWRKQGPDSESGDSLCSSTIGGSSGKSSGSRSGSSCGSRRSNSAIRYVLVLLLLFHSDTSRYCDSVVMIQLASVDA